MVHIRHTRRLKMCNRGQRPWFAKHGLDWSHFLAHGYPASVIRETGDAFALRAVALAEKEARGE